MTLSRRIEKLTKLNLSSSEPLQVAYYGSGGRYDSHFDWGQSTTCNHVLRNYEYSKSTGGRLATFLIYRTSTIGYHVILPSCVTTVVLAKTLLTQTHCAP